MGLNLSQEDIDAIATALSGKLKAQQDQAAHDAIYGHEPNWRDALEKSKAQGNYDRIKLELELKNMLNFAGPINHNSGQGGNTAWADKFLPDGDWWVGTDKNGVTIRVGFASEAYLAAARPGNPWRSECVVEIDGNRYNWTFGSIIQALQTGVVNPTGA